MGRISVFIVLFLLTQQLIFAGSYSTGATSAQFLKISVGAREIALGSAFTSIAEGSDAIFYNSGGLAFGSSRQISFMNLSSFAQINLQNLSYYQPLIGDSGLGFGYIQLLVPDFERYDENGIYLGNFSAQDSLFTVAYSKKVPAISKKLSKILCPKYSTEKKDKKEKLFAEVSLGMNLKMLSSRLDVESASALAFDFSALCKMTSGLNAGIAVLNIGSKMKFIETPYALPVICKIGFSYTKLMKEKLLLSADINLPNDYVPYLSSGAEYKTLLGDNLTIALRGGIKTNQALGGLSLGTGLAYKEKYHADISYDLKGDIGNNFAVTISAEF